MLQLLLGLFGLVKTNPFFDVLLAGSSAAQTMSAIGATAVTASTGAEIYLHRKNQRLGKNPLLKEEMESVLNAGRAQPIQLDEGTFLFFRLTEENAPDEMHAKLRRFWFLTQDEYLLLVDDIRRESILHGKLAEVFSKLADKYDMPDEDRDALDMLTGVREGNDFLRLGVLSDNRLTDRSLTEGFLSVRRAALGLDEVAIEDLENEMRIARGEAQARVDARS
jgi:hypothetical protein